MADNEFLPTYLGYFFVSLSVSDITTMVCGVIGKVVNVTADESVMVDGKLICVRSTPSHLTPTPTAIIKSPSVWAKHSEMD